MGCTQRGGFSPHCPLGHAIWQCHQIYKGIHLPTDPTRAPCQQACTPVLHPGIFHMALLEEHQESSGGSGGPPSPR